LASGGDHPQGPIMPTGWEERINRTAGSAKALRLALVADALGERAGALAGDLDKTGIPGDLIEHR
jgi:hypothetical protein